MLDQASWVQTHTTVLIQDIITIYSHSWRLAPSSRECAWEKNKVELYLIGEYNEDVWDTAHSIWWKEKLNWNLWNVRRFF